MAAGSDRGAPEVFTEINIPGIDSSKGLALYGGDMETYLSIMRYYAKNIQAQTTKLRGATAETLPDCKITAHALKGAGASICADTAKEAAELEKAARNGDLNEFLARLEPFIQDTERLAADITAWFRIYDEANEKPRLREPDLAVLAKLCKSCEAYEISGIDEAMDELEAASYETGGELMIWLREKLDVMEIEEVVARLKEILQ